MSLVCYATLEFKGKKYVVKDSYPLFGAGGNEEDIEEWKHQRRFDWEKNNNSCDCNRALMIQRQHDVNFTTGNEDPDKYEDGTGLAGGPNVICGDKIKLLKLEFREVWDESKRKISKTTDRNKNFNPRGGGKVHKRG